MTSEIGLIEDTSNNMLSLRVIMEAGRSSQYEQPAGCDKVAEHLISDNLNSTTVIAGKCRGCRSFKTKRNWISYEMLSTRSNSLNDRVKQRSARSLSIQQRRDGLRNSLSEQRYLFAKMGPFRIRELGPRRLGDTRACQCCLYHASYVKAQRLCYYL